MVAIFGFAVLVIGLIALAIWVHLHNRRMDRLLSEEQRRAARQEWERIPGDW